MFEFWKMYFRSYWFKHSSNCILITGYSQGFCASNTLVYAHMFRHNMNMIHTPQTSNRWYTVLAFIFPPVGLFVAWKRKKLDAILPKFVSTYSALLFVTSSTMFAAPYTLHTLSPHTSDTVIALIISISLLLTLCVVSCLIGLHYRRQIKKNPVLTNYERAILIGLVLCIVIFNLILSLFITHTLYGEFSIIG